MDLPKSKQGYFRLLETNKRVGVFFGQYREICGVNHGYMPIVVVALPGAQSGNISLDAQSSECS